MTTAALYSMTGVLVFMIGIYGLTCCPHLLRKAMAINIMSTGIFLFLIAMANRDPAGDTDPVPHAMVLTGIVVAVSGTALILALVVFFFELTGRVMLESGSGKRRPKERKEE